MQELVESEREYQLCDRGAAGGLAGRAGGGWRCLFSRSSPLHASVLSLNFHLFFRSPPGMVCVCDGTIPFSHCPSREMLGLLSGVSVYGLQRSVCVCGCI